MKKVRVTTRMVWSRARGGSGKGQDLDQDRVRTERTMNRDLGV